MNKLTLLITILTVVCSCKTTNTEQVNQAIDVNHAGALRKMMHEGDITTKISLDTLGKKNLFGLGALTQLKGELTIINGKVYQSTVLNGAENLQINSRSSASLLVYAYVEKWDTLDVSGVEDIEALVKSKAKSANILEPFPFLLMGQPKEVHYHIVDFNPETDIISDHKSNAFKNKLSEQLTLLGFYSTQAKGIYTHHDSNIHMHLINEKHTASGHVDEIDFGDSNYKLLIPRL